MSDGTINFPVRSTPPDTPATGRIKFWADSTTKAPMYTDDTGLSKSVVPAPSPIRINYPADTETVSDIYEVIGFFSFAGSNEVGIPVTIEALVNITGATSGDIRLFDETNSLVIAELTGFTETNPTLKDLGTLSNIPTGPAILSVQLLRDGAGGQSASLHFMIAKF